MLDVIWGICGVLGAAMLIINALLISFFTGLMLFSYVREKYFGYSSKRGPGLEDMSDLQVPPPT